MLTAALVVAWPMYRVRRRWSLLLASAILIVLTVPIVVYVAIGTPMAPGQTDGGKGSIEALNQHLRKNPGDIDAWKLLGRSQGKRGNYVEAASAFERVVALEVPPSGQSLAELGEALLMIAGRRGSERADSLFESALAIEPTNQAALFYGGMVASDRGDNLLAANRWETLLAFTPSPEMQRILREGISAWRDQGNLGAQVSELPDRVLEISVSLSPSAKEAVAPDDTVFIIARDPGIPSPPIAVAKRTVADLTGTITLSNADAMTQGRSLSAFDELEIVGRISFSNEPAARAGDWYGERNISFLDGDRVELVIDKQVQ